MREAERRETERFRPKNETFIAIKPQFVKLGKILDISASGLCFQYLVRNEQIGDTTALQADIFMSDNGYYLPDVFCKLVWDAEMEEMTFPTGFQSRRCGLQFSGLSKKQKDELDRFLHKHTEI